MDVMKVTITHGNLTILLETISVVYAVDSCFKLEKPLTSGGEVRLGSC